MKLFSIILTVYNKEKTLKKCLNSILNNKFDNYELIIVNDGSKDNSLKIIEDYSKKYNNIKIINIPHKGISYIRKNISKKIKGKYIIFVDADDSIELDLLNILEKTINLYNPDIIKYNINEINSKKDKNRYMIKKFKIYATGVDALKDWNKYNLRYSMFNMYAIKKDVYTKTIKYFIDLKCYEDIANVPKIIYFSKKIINIPYIGYNYYRNDNSITKKEANNIKMHEFKKACNNIINFFKKQLTENDELCLQIKDYYLYHLNRKEKELKHSSS